MIIFGSKTVLAVFNGGFSDFNGNGKQLVGKYVLMLMFPFSGQHFDQSNFDELADKMIRDRLIGLSR